MKINNFRDGLTNISAKTATLKTAIHPASTNTTTVITVCSCWRLFPINLGLTWDCLDTRTKDYLDMAHPTEESKNNSQLVHTGHENPPHTQTACPLLTNTQGNLP